LKKQAIPKSSGEMKTILTKLNADRKNILNPLSHFYSMPIYSQGLIVAMEDIQRVKNYLKFNKNNMLH